MLNRRIQGAPDRTRGSAGKRGVFRIGQKPKNVCGPERYESTRLEYCFTLHILTILSYESKDSYSRYWRWLLASYVIETTSPLQLCGPSEVTQIPSSSLQPLLGSAACTTLLPFPQHTRFGTTLAKAVGSIGSSTAQHMKLLMMLPTKQIP